MQKALKEYKMNRKTITRLSQGTYGVFFFDSNDKNPEHHIYSINEIEEMMDKWVSPAEVFETLLKIQKLEISEAIAIESGAL